MAADKKDDKKGDKPDNKKNDKDNDKEGGAVDGDAAKQKKKKILLIAAAVLLLIVVVVGATVGVLKLMAPKSNPGESGDSEKKELAAEPPKVQKPVVYLALKPNFTVNFDVNGRQRFLQAELTLVYRDTEVLELVEHHMPVIRNSLVLLLSRQSFEELQTSEGKENLRAAALESVNSILHKERENAVAKMTEKEKEKAKKEGSHESYKIEQILFTNFVMQ